MQKRKLLRWQFKIACLAKICFDLSALWLSPIEIIYRICLRYILGFSNEILIEKNNIRLCDTWEYAKKATMDVEMRQQFNL